MTLASKSTSRRMSRSFRPVNSASSPTKTISRRSRSSARCRKTLMAPSVSGMSGKKRQPREEDMADLLDIAPSTSVEVVKIDGKRILVHGLQGHAIALIVSRFPELGLLLGGGGADIGPRLIERFG